MRNRYYDPKKGQFTQQDPIGIAGGLNLYGYANGDPVSLSDPFGLHPCLAAPQACTIAAFVVGGAVGAAAARVAENYRSGAGVMSGVGEAALGGGIDPV
jgi:uncharacterized protein RhaS with RHS repeats